MRIDKILEKVYHIEGLVIALEKMVFDYIEIQKDCYEEYNSVCALLRLLRFKTTEVRHDLAKQV